MDRSARRGGEGKMSAKKIVLAVLFSGTLGFFRPAPAAGQAFAIEYRIFRGASTSGRPASAPAVVTASFADPVFISAEVSDAEKKTEADRIAVLKTELAAIYRLSEVDLVRSSRIVWDGKKAPFGEVVLIGDSFFPVLLSPRALGGQRFSMKVEIRRYRDSGLDVVPGRDQAEEGAPSGGGVRPERDKWESVWGEGERIADSELTARLDETVVLGFPLGESSYFISFRLHEPPEDRFWREVLDRAQKSERTWPSGQTVPPRPRFRFIPAYPKSSRDWGMEGVVILKVRTDEEGIPADISVVKGRSIHLNLAALAAMKQWRFDPMIVDGKAVEASFFISFDFRLGATPGEASPARRPPDF
jgi:TonB family protein